MSCACQYVKRLRKREVLRARQCLITLTVLLRAGSHVHRRLSVRQQVGMEDETWRGAVDETESVDDKLMRVTATPAVYLRTLVVACDPEHSGSSQISMHLPKVLSQSPSRRQRAQLQPLCSVVPRSHLVYAVAFPSHHHLSLNCTPAAVCHRACRDTSSFQPSLVACFRSSTLRGQH